MIHTSATCEAALEALLETLDEAIARQEEVLSQLEAIAEAVGRLDESALCEQLENLDAMASRLAEAGRRRHRARARLAEALGRGVAEVTLGRLARELPAPQAARIRPRRARLRDLGEAVRRQHLRTAILLGEAARITRSLLSALVPQADPPRTYGTDGNRDRAAGRAVLDARL